MQKYLNKKTNQIDVLEIENQSLKKDNTKLMTTSDITFTTNEQERKNLILKLQAENQILYQYFLFVMPYNIRLSLSGTHVIVLHHETEMGSERIVDQINVHNCGDLVLGRATSTRLITSSISGSGILGKGVIARSIGSNKADVIYRLIHFQSHNEGRGCQNDG